MALLSSTSSSSDDVVSSSSSSFDFPSAEDFEGVPTDLPQPVTAQQQEQEDDLHWFRFAGIGKLYGQVTPSSATAAVSDEVVLDRLQQATVAIVGVGGVGTWAAESLVRSGVGHVVLVDLDDFCVSHTHRQLYATAATVGKAKTRVLADQLQAMHPRVRVTEVSDFVMTDNAHDIVQTIRGEAATHGSSEGAIVVLDTLAEGATEDKAALWRACLASQIPVVTCGSPAGRRDPTTLQCQPLAVAQHTDALLAHTVHAFQQDDTAPNVLDQIPCVYAPLPVALQQGNDASSAATTKTPVVGGFRSDLGNLGTASFVSGSMGLIAASRIVEGIAWQNV